MGRSWGLLLMAVLVGLPGAALSQDRDGVEQEPTLEYRPRRPEIVEPKTPIRTPVLIFREVIGSYGNLTGSFDEPVDVVRDPSGGFYVLDARNYRIQRFDSFGNFVTTFGGAFGSRPGEFNKPRAIALQRNGNTDYVFVADTGNHRIEVFAYDLIGNKARFLDSWGTLGVREGDFKDPVDIMFDGEGKLWVVDQGNERVQRFAFDPAVTRGSTGRFEQSWGRAFGAARGGDFADQVSMAWSKDRLGFIFLLGPGCTVQQFRTDGTFIKSWPGIAPDSGLCVPARIEVDNTNNWIYVLDAGNGMLLRFDLEGNFLAAIRGGLRNFAKPLGFTMDAGGGEFLVADTENNSVQKFTLR